MQTGSTATEPRRVGGAGGDISDPTDHSFNSGGNTVMAHRQTVTDTGGQQESEGKKNRRRGKRRRRRRKKENRQQYKTPCC